MFFKPGHYDIVYSKDFIQKLNIEDQCTFYTYDNDFYAMIEKVQLNFNILG